MMFLLSVGKRAEIWSQKFWSSWRAKLEFSLRPLSNPSLIVTHVRCVMNVIIRLWISFPGSPYTWTAFSYCKWRKAGWGLGTRLIKMCSAWSDHIKNITSLGGLLYRQFCRWSSLATLSRLYVSLEVSPILNTLPLLGILILPRTSTVLSLCRGLP